MESRGLHARAFAVAILHDDGQVTFEASENIDKFKHQLFPEAGWEQLQQASKRDASPPPVDDHASHGRLLASLSNTIVLIHQQMMKRLFRPPFLLAHHSLMRPRCRMPHLPPGTATTCLRRYQGRARVKTRHQWILLWIPLWIPLLIPLLADFCEAVLAAVERRRLTSHRTRMHVQPRDRISGGQFRSVSITKKLLKKPTRYAYGKYSKWG